MDLNETWHTYIHRVSGHCWKVFQNSMQGDHSSWKVMEFSKTIFQAWKVMENSQGHGKSWKVVEKDDDVLEFFVKMH